MATQLSAREGRAFVKSVLSADTILLRGKPAGGPPPEKLMSLAYVTAPRLGTAKEPAKEEAFAFEAREYLRKLLVGKEVAFKVEYTTTTNARDFGSILLHPSQAVDGETNVTKILLKNGCVRVRREGKSQQPSEEFEELVKLEEDAAARGVGLHASDIKPRKVNYSLDSTADFAAKYKGSALPAVIEQVRDGSTLRVLMQLPDKSYQFATLLISGVKAPLVKQGVPGIEDVIEPFGLEARYFVEVRLLLRDVKVVVEGASNNFIVGSVQFPAGNIAEALLLEGFARVSDWTLSNVTGGAPQMTKLRNCESQAKEKKLRIWKDYESNKSVLSGRETQFEGTVIRILTADSIVVTSAKTHVDHKLSLASIRAPKLKDVKESYYNAEAKEYLRKRLIGRNVSVAVDYVQPANEANGVKYDEKVLATIKINGQNIAEKLLERGLAFIIRHRKDDEQRSREYDALSVAYDKALNEKKGVHSEKEPPVVRITDASENQTKAKSFLSFYSRSLLSVVVDYVVSPTRFKLVYPKESARLVLVLGGLRVPKPAQVGEQLASEIISFVNRVAMQRDVEVKVEGVDRTGAFIGQMFIESPSATRINLAVEIVRNGYATVHEGIQLAQPLARELNEAENEAKRNKKGVWGIEGFVKDEYGSSENLVEQVEDASSFGLDEQRREVVVSDVSPAGKISVQFMDEDIHKLETMMNQLSLYQSQNQDTVRAVKTGDMVTAQSLEDDGWYRAKVIKSTPDNKSVTVTYVDYGNTETVPVGRVRPLPSQFSLSTLGAQSHTYQLAFISLPDSNNEFHMDSMEYLQDLVSSQRLFLRACNGSANASKNVVLVSDNNDLKQSVNAKLVRAGLATVDTKVFRQWQRDQVSSVRSKEDKLRAYLQAQGKATKTGTTIIDAVCSAMEEAKSQRANLWRFGDFMAEDDEM